jgi:hypothetical protein
LGLNQYDAFYRTFDPQIGRFLQIDPKIESAESWSPFSAMLDNPVTHSDPLGDSTIKPIAGRFTEHELRKRGILIDQPQKEGDQTGTIRNATPDEYDSNPWGALGKDIIWLAAELTGLNAVDNASATVANPNETTENKVLAVISAGLNTPGKGRAAFSGGGEFKVPTLKEQALQLKELNNGKNSITIQTPDKQIRFDLDGKPHGEVETPSKQVYKKNFVNGVQKSISRESRQTQPLTQQEIRIVRKYIEHLQKNKK